MRKYRNLEERLLANSEPNYDHWYNGTPCWDWTGRYGTADRHRLGAGAYPQINIHVRGKSKRGRPKTFRAHRVSLEVFRGIKLRKGQEANHLCCRTFCINPMHLERSTRRKQEQYKRLMARIVAPKQCNCGDDGKIFFEGIGWRCYPCSYGVAVDLDAQEFLNAQSRKQGAVNEPESEREGAAGREPGSD